MRDDKEFFNVIKNLANSSIDGYEDRRAAELKAAEYLWDGSNWERLKETPHGRYLRECGSVNKVPDYGLRSLYRKQVLESRE